MRRGYSSPNRSPKRQATSPSASKFSYELFELAHVLRVRPRTNLKDQDGALNTAKRKYEMLFCFKHLFVN